MDLSNDNVIHCKKDDIEYLQFRRLLEYEDNIKHAFSLGINYDFRISNKMTEEQQEHNKACYKNICKYIGINYTDIVKPNQVHKDRIKNIEKKVNEYAPDFLEEAYKETDGLITNKSNIAICTTNADCIGLMMYDNVKKVIANIHSGWRGTVQRIGAKTIDKMQEIYGCKPKDIICCITPSIRQCHFEVDNDVKEIFENNFKNLQSFMLKQEKWHIDTVKLNIEMLKEKGLRKENIIDSKICTVCNSRSIHSYRGSNHNNGLEMGIIELK